MRRTASGAHVLAREWAKGPNGVVEVLETTHGGPGVKAVVHRGPREHAGSNETGHDTARRREAMKDKAKQHRKKVFIEAGTGAKAQSVPECTLEGGLRCRGRGCSHTLEDC